MNINNFPLTLDAIEVDQPLGKFYAISIKASVLCDLAFSIPAKYADQALSGTQRQIKEERTDKISQFVNGVRATFPNSVILGANYHPNGDIVDDDSVRWRVRKVGSSFKLIIPAREKMASIIDGQHRLEGFRKSFEREKDPQDMDMLCSIYFDLPSPEQAEIFATINYNQQKVDKSLAYQLFGYDIDESKDSNTWPPDTLAVYFSRLLNSEQTSPLNTLIRSGLVEEFNYIDKEDKNNSTPNLPWQGMTVSTAAVVEGLVKLYSTDPIADRYKINKRTFYDRGRKALEDARSQAPLRNLYVSNNDKAIFEIVVNYLTAVKDVFWKKAKKESKVLSTIGLLAIFDVLRHILKAINISKISCSYDNFSNILRDAGEIDFSDEFFNFAGIGRSQVANIIILRLNLDHEVHSARIERIKNSKDISRLYAVINKYKIGDQ